MTGGRNIRSTSIGGVRAELVTRLRNRLSEIEDAIFATVRTLSPRAEHEDSAYVAGLRTTVAEVVNFALAVIEHGEGWQVPVPAAAAVQARRAARNDVKLGMVLRRYAVGDKLLEEFILDEAEGIPNQVVGRILGTQAPHVDRLMEAVAGEYMREIERMRRSPALRLAEDVQELLADEHVTSVSDFDYDFNAWHIGMIILGRRAESLARGMASRFDRQVLVVSRGDEIAWAWLGGRRKLAIEQVERFLEAAAIPELSVAFGDQQQGQQGWRLTHHEAQAGLQVMLHRPENLVRGSDVVLLAAMLRDETLARCLQATYLAPLDAHGDFGSVLRETLRAYLAAGQNAASAASMLKVDRSTVQRHIRKIEGLLGRVLHTCQAELKVALELEELEEARRRENPA
jgi:PucR C-terminal helix-turn-helix domain